jgi:hypothetical protein
MMFAPDNTNLIAPRSTWIFVNASGSIIDVSKGRAEFTFMHQSQRRSVNLIEMLKEKHFVVQCQERNMLSAS